MEVAYDLAGEPLVQLFVRVQHESFLLGSLLALGHQRGIFIPFKQTRNLSEKPERERRRGPNVMAAWDRMHGLYLSVGQQGVHSLKESRIQDIGLVHNESNLLIFAARAPQHSS